MKTKVAFAAVILAALLVSCGTEAEKPVDVGGEPADTGTSQSAESPQDAEPSQETESPQETEPSQETESPQETEPSQETESPQETKPSQSAESPQEAKPSRGTESPQETKPSQETEPPQEAEPSKETEPPEDGGDDGDRAALTLLTEGGTFVGCGTQSGFYYLTLGAGRLADGRDGHHLMYMDYATRQEVYLCSDPSCGHNTADCTSVFPTDEFQHNNVMLFTIGGKLYMLVSQPDQEGVVVMGSSGGASTQSGRAELYRMNADGTGRRKIYTFGANLTVENFAAGDGGGLYFITKKVSTTSDGGSTYFTATDRKLVRLDLATGKLSTVCGMDFGDYVDWSPAGVRGRELILTGIDFGRAVTSQEMKDDRGLYDSACHVFAALDVDTGKLRELYRVKRPKSQSWALDGETLYYAVDGSGEILAVSLADGRERVLCKTSHNSIWGIVGGMLYTWEYGDGFYFIDPADGSISRCGLKNKTVGTHIEIVAEAGDRVLVIYDCDATVSKDGSFSTRGNYYALISLADLAAGRENYAPIKMVEAGM